MSIQFTSKRLGGGSRRLRADRRGGRGYPVVFPVVPVRLPTARGLRTDCRGRGSAGGRPGD